MLDQLLDTWSIHQKMNRLVITNTSPAAMQLSLGSKGRTIYQQWIHVNNVRHQWLNVIAKKTDVNFIQPDKDDKPSIDIILKSLEQSGNAIAAVLETGWNNNGKLKGFKKGVLPFLGYLIAHESHHRGNILLTLKQSGEKLPDVLKWEIWDWNN